MRGFKATIMYAVAPSFAVFWTLYLLFLNPNDSNSNLLTNKTRNKNRNANRGDDTNMYSDLIKCRNCDKYLRAFIKEVLRLYPPVPVLMTRTAVRDCKYKFNQENKSYNVNIPKGSTIVISPLLAHHSKYLWKNPLKFDPNRFIQQQNTDLENTENQIERPSSSSEYSLKYLPFGYGQHACLGRQYAEKEVFTIVKTIINACDIKLVDDFGLNKLPLTQRCYMEAFLLPLKEPIVSIHKKQ